VYVRVCVYVYLSLSVSVYLPSYREIFISWFADMKAACTTTLNMWTIYICTYTCIHTYRHTHTYIHICIGVYTNVYTYICMNIYICIYTVHKNIRYTCTGTLIHLHGLTKNVCFFHRAGTEFIYHIIDA